MVMQPSAGRAPVIDVFVNVCTILLGLIVMNVNLSTTMRRGAERPKRIPLNVAVSSTGEKKDMLILQVLFSFLQITHFRWYAMYYSCVSACNCNGFSQRCYFDKDLYQQTGHGGHCLECSSNRDGPNCERCRANYYQPSGETACYPCNCNEIGTYIVLWSMHWKTAKTVAMKIVKVSAFLGSLDVLFSACDSKVLSLFHLM